MAERAVQDCKSIRAKGFDGGPKLIFDINGHGLSIFHRNPEYQKALKQADIIHSDGGFFVTFSKFRFRHPIRERSATTDMIHDLAKVAVKESLSFYLLGGTEDVNSQCAAELLKMYPGLKISGRRNGYFSSEQIDEIVQDINLVKPDLLWIGLGKPFEQILSVKIKNKIDAGWIITCGGCFNFITGKYKRAPIWMQKRNLEWLYRMMTSPRALFYRYLVTTPHALWLTLVHTSSGKNL